MGGMVMNARQRAYVKWQHQRQSSNFEHHLRSSLGLLPRQEISHTCSISYREHCPGCAKKIIQDSLERALNAYLTYMDSEKGKANVG